MASVATNALSVWLESTHLPVRRVTAPLAQLGNFKAVQAKRIVHHARLDIGAMQGTQSVPSALRANIIHLPIQLTKVHVRPVELVNGHILQRQAALLVMLAKPQQSLKPPTLATVYRVKQVFTLLHQPQLHVQFASAVLTHCNNPTSAVFALPGSSWVIPEQAAALIALHGTSHINSKAIWHI